MAREEERVTTTPEADRQISQDLWEPTWEEASGILLGQPWIGGAEQARGIPPPMAMETDLLAGILEEGAPARAHLLLLLQNQRSSYPHSTRTASKGI